MLSGVTVISAWIGSMSPNSASSTTGASVPSTRPMTTPIAATARTCVRKMPSTMAAGGADALHGGDDLAPLVDERRHGVGDADAADEQRRQADERQELAQPIERAAHLRRGIAAVGDR